MSAMSNSLNYAQLKRKSVSARNYRISMRSQSGLKFNSNSSFSISLPQLSRSFLDANNMYLMFELSSATALSTGILDYSAYSIFSRITVSSGNGAVIEDCNYWNIYQTLLLQSQCSEEFHKGYGAECAGMAGRPGCPFGANVPGSGTPTTICIPLLTGLATANRLLPLDVAAPLTFTFYIDDYNKFLVRKNHAIALTDIEISTPRLVANVTELSEGTNQLLESSLGDLGMNINYTGLVSTVDVKQPGAGTHISNLAFRNSSLNKITLVMQAQEAKGTAANKNFSISNRSSGKLQEISYFIAGSRMPQQKISLVNGFAEVHTENLLAGRVLMDPTHHSSLNYSHVETYPAGYAAGSVHLIPKNNKNFECEIGKHTQTGNLSTEGATQFDLSHFNGNQYGTFYSTYNFETFKSPTDDSGIFSGINCLGQTCQAELVFAAQTNADGQGNANVLDLYYYGEVDKILSLDPLTRSFVVSD